MPGSPQHVSKRQAAACLRTLHTPTCMRLGGCAAMHFQLGRFLTIHASCPCLFYCRNGCEGLCNGVTPDGCFCTTVGGGSCWLSDSLSTDTD